MTYMYTVSSGTLNPTQLNYALNHGHNSIATGTKLYLPMRYDDDVQSQFPKYISETVLSK